MIPDGVTVNAITYDSSSGNGLVTNVFLTSSVPNGLGDTGFFQAGDSITSPFAGPKAFSIDINTFSLINGAYVASTNLGDVIPTFLPQTATSVAVCLLCDRRSLGAGVHPPAVFGAARLPAGRRIASLFRECSSRSVGPFYRPPSFKTKKLRN